MRGQKLIAAEIPARGKARAARSGHAQRSEATSKTTHPPEPAEGPWVGKDAATEPAKSAASGTIAAKALKRIRSHERTKRKPHRRGHRRSRRARTEAGARRPAN